jgi:GT2 family glycosyltransferase
MKATVVIPNYNGIRYLQNCLDSLRHQNCRDFHILLIDNGSTDGSVALAAEHYPEAELVCFETNRGFCEAVNEGIRRSCTPYVILLNNDTICEPDFVSGLIDAMEAHPDSFSCASRMVMMQDENRMDNGGDYYCALGWAYACGKGRPVSRYLKQREIFSACAGAAIYRRSVFDEIGLFDEVHFAYLEDVDVAYRARIAGYRNYYEPSAVVHHVGSATSGSVYNEFKIRHSSRNSIYLIYKNMPLAQIILNLPFLVIGFLVKAVFFTQKGYGREYITGLYKGVRLCDRSKKVRFRKKNLGHYLRIQWELWINILRRFSD